MSEPKIDWQEVRQLFHASLDLPQADREHFLEQACQDSRLREEVWSLLRHHEDQETLLPDRSNDRRASRIDRVDRYALVDVIGRGGMGVVYRARRDDGSYDEEVALKLLHAELFADDLVQRFWRERQILADLKHPAIARLIDGGTAADGRPFLVMELVDGKPIDRYVQTHRLGIRDRLTIFAKVCRAVHFAHQNLVVHRDLKPANLLVDADGQPRLLDFGVAKLIDPAAPELTRLGTIGDASPMTPQYASPEQVSGTAITTASDIYSLGAILYLLVTGSHPLGRGSLSLSELVEAICHQDPPAPSTRVRLANGEEAEGGLAALAPRAADRARLGRELTGDIDRIVAMAMDKRPARRYASAEALAQDVERHLGGLPVLAREQTVAYRLGKFLARHRWSSLSAAIVAVAIGVLIIGLVIQRSRLLEEKALSSEVTDYLEGLFEVSTPEVNQGRNVLARELLDQGARDVRSRFADQPRLRSRLVSTMGRAYLRLGHFDEAEDLLETSLDVRRSLYSGTHPEVVDGLLDLGDLRAAQGAFDAAEEAFERAAASLEESRDRDDVQRLRSLIGIAEAHRERGQYEEALALQGSALELARRAFGEEHRLFADALHGLGAIERLRGDLEAAQARLEEARAIDRSIFGELHPEVARLGVQIALVLEQQGRYAEAEAELRASREIRAAIYPPGHPEHAIVLNNLASVVLALGRSEEAEALCREALAIRRAALEEGHPSISDSLNLLGVILIKRGKDAEAEDVLRAARDLLRANFGADHVELAATANNLGQILRRRGAMKEAEAELVEALQIYRTVYGDKHLQVATVLNNLAYLHKEQGDAASARGLYRQALDILEDVFGGEHPRTAVLSNNLAVLLNEADQAAEAEPLFRRALSVFEGVLPAGHSDLAAVRRNLADSLHALGRLDEAETLLRSARETYRQADPAAHRESIEKIDARLAQIASEHPG